ncbi:MAG TPA: N-acetyl-gamma-glutamyl-phosphate reductase [Gaiellaceae bacterium]|jgi:N-acetyl-gamma-glutamyl-phosphate reductase|nr:N-acetyl-gamma-glutamyl-phosphate reductase [Gaiellaceae bacterium]
MATVAIVGASGYTGQETLDRVLAHPALELYALGSDSLAGQPAGTLDPRLGRNGWSRIPRFITNEAALSAGADVVFLCLSHEEAARLEPPARGVVVDLSGGHRFADPGVYPAWYGFDHPSPQTLGDWAYGLPELAAPTGRLIANPGCYATAALLALAPIADAIEPVGVVVDAMSGMTGAGRSPRPSSHAGAVLENVSPYKVGTHQHAPEIAAQLGFPVTFVPHLLPVRRGLLATCFVHSRGGDLRELLEEHYAESHVVDVLPEGVVPELARVQQTDGAEIGVFEDSLTGTSIVICALDNLGKGAAGQAIQNVNLLFGLAETTGLRLSGVLV